jgi:thymidylate synthase
MTYCVNAVTALDAWKQGAGLLLNNGEVYNLITTVTDPTVVGPNWVQDYNPATLKPGIQSLSDVANTIFPYKYLARNYSRQQLYDRYLTVHERAKRIHRQRRNRWGTYFDRMIRFGSDEINQLERVVRALATWTNNPRAALVIHTSSADTDRPRPIGGPCLQYVELLCADRNSVSLLAVYRNHDYFEKVLGNFVGLGQLLRFVCQETNRNPESLVCHSAHAYYQATKANFKALARV